MCLRRARAARAAGRSRREPTTSTLRAFRRANSQSPRFLLPVALGEYREVATTTGRGGPAYGLIRMRPDFHSPLRVAVPYSNRAGWASTTVSNLRSEPQ